MSYAVDVNILLCASDRGSRHHAEAAQFLSECARRTEVFCLAWITLMSYLRIATHPRIFARPLDPSTAMRNVHSLLSLPQVRVLSEQDRFWTCYEGISQDLKIRGNLVADAHLVALLIEHDVPVLYTHDRDFRKFEHIRVSDPLTGGDGRG